MYLRSSSYIFEYEIVRTSKFTTTHYMKPPKPTESELEILQVLWQEGPCTVRTVNERLNEKRETGYTTTLKFLQIMTDKGLCIRNTDDRTHIYQAAISESEIQSELLRQFVDSTFRGSAMKLVMQALGNHEASTEELNEIKALIEQIKNNG